MEVTVMLKTPELTMPRTRKATTVCNGKREVWKDYEEAKVFFPELMMSTDRTRFGQLYVEWRAKHITGRDFMRRMAA